MPRHGRPTKLTPAIQTAIVQAISLGVPTGTAAAYVGITKACFLQWLQRGEGTHPTRPATTRYVDFVAAIEKAKAIDETRRIARLEQAARGGQVTRVKTTTYPDGRVTREECTSEPQWTVDAWFLERSYPDRWGRRERMDVRLSIEQLYARVAEVLGLETQHILDEAMLIVQERDNDDSRRPPLT